MGAEVHPAFWWSDAKSFVMLALPSSIAAPLSAPRPLASFLPRGTATAACKPWCVAARPRADWFPVRRGPGSVSRGVYEAGTRKAMVISRPDLRTSAPMPGTSAGGRSAGELQQARLPFTRHDVGSV